MGDDKNGCWRELGSTFICVVGILGDKRGVVNVEAGLDDEAGVIEGEGEGDGDGDGEGGTEKGSTGIFGFVFISLIIDVEVEVGTRMGTGTGTGTRMGTETGMETETGIVLLSLLGIDIGIERMGTMTDGERDVG